MDLTGLYPTLTDNDSVYSLEEYSARMRLALGDAPLPPRQFLNGWANFGSGYDGLTFSCTGNLVTVTGMIKPGTVSSGVVVANTPLSLPPRATTNTGVTMSVAGDFSKSCVCTFKTNGEVSLSGMPSNISYLMFSCSYLRATPVFN